MDELESKLLAEALNKIDKLTQCVVILETQMTLIRQNITDLAELAQKADKLLFDKLVELTIQIGVQSVLQEPNK
jgi:hypothetical protein